VKKVIEVVGGIIQRRDDPDGRILVCKRPISKAQGGLWEFAGGKLEAGETHEEALVRECREELGITVSPGERYIDLEHEYHDVVVHLSLYDAWIDDQEPQPLEHEAIRWATPLEFSELEFCPADVSVLARLSFDYAKERIPLGIWQHFKGNRYETLGIAKHSETLEPMVVYRALYGEGGIWVRPAAMWLETVTREGKTFPRFTYLSKKEEI
jgi:8-oxo-dGTP diphosphatase